MPFSLFGSQQPTSFDFTAFNDPGPSPYASGLTLADLWQPAPQPEYPEPPQAITSASQLDDERKRQLRQQVLLQAAQAIGAGSANGQIGTYLTQAAQEVEDYRGQMVAQAQQEAQQRYGAERAQAESAFRQQQSQQAEEQARRKAEAVLGIVQQISSEDPTLAPQAEAAAREGRTDDLRKMLAELPRRRAMRDLYQLDPDNPFADETMKDIIRRQGERDQEEYYKRFSLKNYFQEPEESPEAAAARAGAIAEAQAAAYARHRAQGSGDDGLKPRWMETGDLWGVGQLGPDGKPVFTPAEGMQARPRYELIKDPNPYDGDDSGWANPYDPSAPLIPVNRQAGPKPAAPAAPQGQKARPDKQRLADIESVVGKLPDAAKKQVLADLKAGKRPRDIVAQIKAARGK